MSQWMVSLNKLSDEQRQFINEIVPSIKWKHFTQICQELQKVNFDIRPIRLTLKDYQFHFNKYCKKPSLLVQGYEFKMLLRTIIAFALDLIIHKANTKIAILVPNKFLSYSINEDFEELNIKNIEVEHYFDFIQENNESNYDYIFVIEIRELTYKMVRSIQSKSKILICTNTSFFLSGDTLNQYTKESTISDKEMDFVTSTWNMNTIYRLPKSLVKLVSIFMPSMGILSSKTDNTKKDITPSLAEGSSKEKEVEYIISNAQTKIGIGENAVIILASKEEVIEFINMTLQQSNKKQWDKSTLNGLNEYLDAKNINIVYVGYSNFNLLAQYILESKIIIISYKNSKYLSFDNVYLPFLSTNSNLNDKNLFINTICVSRLLLTFTYSSEMPKYLKFIENECNKIDIDKIMSQSSSNFDDDFDF